MLQRNCAQCPFRRWWFPDLIGRIAIQVGVVLSLGEGNATTSFITGIAGSAAAWPFAAQGQPRMPVVRFLQRRSGSR
jgi:hypothetical protein